jgi:hypothetical protein
MSIQSIAAEQGTPHAALPAAKVGQALKSAPIRRAA